MGIQKYITTKVFKQTQREREREREREVTPLVTLAPKGGADGSELRDREKTKCTRLANEESEYDP